MALAHEKTTAERAREKADKLMHRSINFGDRSSNVNRRLCEGRVRPMEVLCLGLERTGTSSLRVALLQLGYFDVYHMKSAAVENPSDADMWCDAFDAKAAGKDYGKENWDRLLGHCMAVTDNPATCFGPELIRAYPSAKVILNARDSPAVWQASAMQTTYQLALMLDSPKTQHSPWTAPFRALKRLLKPNLSFNGMFRRLIAAVHYWDLPTRGEQMYEEHYELMRRSAREAGSEVLEYNVKQGWGPLCEFLRKPVPETPFPRVNESAEFQEKLGKLGMLIKVLYVVNAVKFTAPVVVAGLLWRYWGRLGLARIKGGRSDLIGCLS